MLTLHCVEDYFAKNRGQPKIELGTSRTLSENLATRPLVLLCRHAVICLFWFVIRDSSFVVRQSWLSTNSEIGLKTLIELRYWIEDVCLFNSEIGIEDVHFFNSETVLKTFKRCLQLRNWIQDVRVWIVIGSTQKSDWRGSLLQLRNCLNDLFWLEFSHCAQTL
jgi:hypothetical protein